MSTSIQISGHRSPFSAALAAAKADDDESLSIWQEECSEMLCEFAGRFFGTFTESMLRSSMAAVDAILSIGLLHSIGAPFQPDEFYPTLKAQGIRGLASSSAQLIGHCAALPLGEGDPLFATHDSKKTREELARQCFSLSRKTGAHSAYDFLLKQVRERTAMSESSHLAKWLLSNTESGRRFRDDPLRFVGHDGITADEVFRFVIPIECGIVKFSEQPIYAHTTENFDEDDLHALAEAHAFFTLPKSRYKECRATFTAFRSALPDDARIGLHPSWFEQNVKEQVKGSADRPRVA